MTAPAATVEAIRDAGAHVFVVATGAGAGLQDLLWQAPGISQALLGAAFPYAALETDELLGFCPASYCSRETAIELGTAAFLRAKAADPARRAAGLGLTASVASRAVHRGEHRIHAAVVTDDGAWALDRTLEKGTGERRALDGRSADLLGLGLLAHALLGAGADGAPDEVSAQVGDLFWRRPLFHPDGRRTDAAALPSAAVLFPGSFNPLHEGHRAMAAAIQTTTGRPVIYAINADSPHKAPLAATELLARAAGLRQEKWRGGAHPVLFTRGEPLYVDKARAHPGAAFVVGADALARMLDPAWGPDPREVLATLRAHGVRFFVFGREQGGAWLTCASVLATFPALAASYGDMFENVEGRWPVSSSEVRQRNGGQ